MEREMYESTCPEAQAEADKAALRRHGVLIDEYQPGFVPATPSKALHPHPFRLRDLLKQNEKEVVTQGLRVSPPQKVRTYVLRDNSGSMSREDVGLAASKMVQRKNPQG